MSSAVSLSHDGFMRKGETSAGSAAAGFLFYFFNSDGGSLYTILYSNHIKKFNIRQAAYVVSSKRPTFLRTCVYAAVVYISAIGPAEKRL